MYDQCSWPGRKALYQVKIKGEGNIMYMARTHHLIAKNTYAQLESSFSRQFDIIRFVSDGTGLTIHMTKRVNAVGMYVCNGIFECFNNIGKHFEMLVTSQFWLCCCARCCGSVPLTLSKRDFC